MKLRLTDAGEPPILKMLLTYSSVTAAFAMVIFILLGLSG